jgi:hypothetical protein
MMGGCDTWLVNKLENCQAAKLNFGALQVSFPCPHFEVGSNPKGIVSVNLANSASETGALGRSSLNARER